MHSYKRTLKVTLLFALSAGLISACSEEQKATLGAELLSKSISQASILDHLASLEGLSSATTDGNSITRVAGSEGYSSSVEFIVGKMEALGYQVELQSFDFRSWEELPGSAVQVDGVNLLGISDIAEGETADYAAMSYSASSTGKVMADIAFVSPDFRFGADDYDSTDGCEVSDFDGLELTGKIAVIQRGGCSFNQKVVNAQQAGAAAALIFNQGNDEGRTAVVNGTLGSDSEAVIPAFGVRFDLGEQWYQASLVGTVTGELTISTDDNMIVTENIIAETKRGDAEQVVMLGAHLDSVAVGPGINDNGSGSVGLLEYATRLAKYEHLLKNKVRFAWWAAEEAGLVGSEYYTNDLFGPLYNTAQQQILFELGLDDVSELSPEQSALVDQRYNQLNHIKLYLNFDMIGSPNYIFGVMDGDLSDTKDSPDNAYTGDFTPPVGTSNIESVFNRFFSEQAEQTVPQALSKRSDYAGFADWGVAFGGLFTGAERVKSVAEAEAFGGEAEQAYDPCYHQACDDLNNVSAKAAYINTQALAYVTTYYAMKKELFPVEPVVQQARFSSSATYLPIGTKLKAAPSHSDHGHFHGDLDQDRE
ncbi:MULTISPECIES: M28 family metallopeptidase [unclassified Agarivorans]|uniref:M28 family metallopeptidase n=1 Tax=unclassified Agarivorans TaxID=2636026 RepID=UPI0026E1B419|nr:MULTISPECIES: M28 family metallopeptidase [unclassified Agarivorans]MDO6684838.1 M28 family peptidase [Agarivorans sp. 3_MG-2023]MDO6715001.1 M28 family peptidase [Agarivorans sp. 2_MG-2023]